MKTGRSLVELASEIERQEQTKIDYVKNTAMMAVVSQHTGGHVLAFPDNGASVEYSLAPLARRQIGERVGIPAKYVNRMAEAAPDLLATNFNHWLHKVPENRMVRVLDGRARAFLSDRYQRRDNYDLLVNMVPMLKQVEGLTVGSCELTESKLYLKLVSQTLQGEIRVGDVVQAGVSVSNSEVGLGAFIVSPFLLRRVCDNGMNIPEYGINKYHLGKRIPTDDHHDRLFTDEAREADDNAFWLACRDVIGFVLNEENFNQLINRIAVSADHKIEVRPVEAVERLAQRYQLTQGESEGVLTQLLRENDMTQYGMANAITYTSKESDDYDRASDLETLGGKVITLNKSEWRELVA